MTSSMNIDFFYFLNCEISFSLEFQKGKHLHFDISETNYNCPIPKFYSYLQLK